MLYDLVQLGLMLLAQFDNIANQASRHMDGDPPVIGPGKFEFSSWG